MREPLITLSGANKDVLLKCPTERGKFQGLGGAVLTTSVLAALSMWFALWSAVGVHPAFAAPLALLWGLAILGLDRWLVASMPSSGRRWPYAVPRILMAMLLGLVVSTPLVLQIFRAEIDAQVAEIKQRRTTSFLTEQNASAVGQEVKNWTDTVDNLNKIVQSGGEVPVDPAADPRIKALTKERTDAQQRADDLYQEWQCQLYGGDDCSVAKVGDGPLAKASEDAYDKAKKRVQTLTDQIEARKRELTSTDDNAKQARLEQATTALPEAQRQLAVAVQRQDDLRASFDRENQASGGLLLRIQALNEITSGDFSLSGARLLLFLLFLLIECLPVAFKLMLRTGNYERILEHAQQSEYRHARAAYSRRGAGGEAAGARSMRQVFADAGGTAQPAEPSGDRPRPDQRVAPEPVSTPTEARLFRAAPESTSVEHRAVQNLEDTRVDPSRDLFAADDEF
ncbi:DUF4407 domain-containing protein [Actinocorallia sp. API 0066]|uniref:DUF4407 domain-containing protein n=1 Tax=Actinocorallia sp. API 0066 TaxID=2896846 RepID=UPI001E30FA40|nr:DUF4407 domain-containing protein [Actinocorallia sp. API 0066]MCD0453290.1 DUF4407 domain-containing protein [Actinocorallia sp. API 0066]